MNKIGFGFLRLPQTADKQIDYDVLNTMVDAFLAQGGTYFDTAYTYLKGESERALRKTLVERHPRASFLLTDKLPTWLLKSSEDCRKYYEEQLERCGVTHFDTYLLHWLNADNYALAQKYGAFEFLQELKRRGEVSRIGFSFHDTAEMLDRILTEHPEMDYVQLQLNYLDWDSAGVQAARCYETAVKHGKQVLVMEPVKGGTLAQLPEEAETMLRAARPDDSVAAWAIRFAQSLEQVSVVLSGMSDLQQVLDNMKDRPALSEEETALIWKARDIKLANTAIACTGCSYCTAECPQNIAIPSYFKLYNEYTEKPAEAWKLKPTYGLLTLTHGAATSCLQCGQCEAHCPQKLPIMHWLQEVGKILG